MNTTELKPSDVKSGDLTLVETKLETTVQQAQLEPATAQGLLDTYRPLFAKAHELCATAANLTVTDATQVTEMKQARVLRLALRALRIDAEKSRKAMKEDSVRRGKAIDGVYHVFEYAVAPVEERMLELEEFAIRAEAARKTALRTSREELLRPFGVDSSFYNLAEMPEATFAQLLDSTRLAHEAKQAAARKAEEERIAKEKAEAEERERIRLDNERLKREAIQREADAKKERDAAATQLAEQRRKADEAAAIERQRVAAEKAAADKKARAEREEIERKAKADREAREKLEAEAKAARDREAARQAAEVAELARAAAAPDREKLLSFAALVRTLEVPEMSTAQGKRYAKSVADSVEAAARAAEQFAEILNQREAA